MTINKTIEFINGLGNFPLIEQTEQLLQKYSWELRFQEEHTLLPLKEFEKVQNQIKNLGPMIFNGKEIFHLFHTLI